MPSARLLPVLLGCAAVSATPAVAAPQSRGVATQRAANAQATANMRSRVAAAIDRVRVTEEHGKISPARSAAVRQQFAQVQAEMARSLRQRGFVSAGELASYDRMIVAVDAELGAGASGHAYGNDALPSAEVTAFQLVHERLNYRDARIEYDASNCALYRGIAPGGRERNQPLSDTAGRRICAHR